MTPVSHAAARTDRRPVAGGVYDAVAHKTFITWAGAHEDNFIQAYDHDSGTWSAPVRTGDGDDDSHNYPTLVQAADGHLLVFHSLHNTELRVARSPQAHAIVSTRRDLWLGLHQETAHDFDKTFAVDTRPMKYVRSLDNGLTWQGSADLTGDRWAIAPLDRPDNMNEIYIGQLRYQPATLGRPERVDIVYTLAGGGYEGHLHDRYHRNIYYAYFTPRDLHFHAADGRDLGTAVDNSEQEKYLKVAQTALVPTPFPRTPDYIQLVGDVVFDHPFVVWMELGTDGLVHDHAAIWTGTGWQAAVLGTGLRVRDMEPVDPFTWRVYATVDAPVPPPGIVTGGYRPPARILATGNSSARDVAVADGDVYVAG